MLVWQVLLYAGVAGLTVFCGGLLAACYERFGPNGDSRESLLHTLTAFGGGIILAAVALILVPEGMKSLSLWSMTGAFLSGGFVFFALDAYIAQKGGKVAQLLVMLLDFIPEAIALGALFAVDPRLGVLLAFFIGLQNLPEAFNAYGDLRKSGFLIKSALVILFVLSLFGPAGALIGYVFLRELPEITALMMIFASGGILYLIFQDIAPMSKWANHRYPALGVNFGFMLGMIGHHLLK